MNNFIKLLDIKTNGDIYVKDRYINNNGKKILQRTHKLTPIENGLGYFQIRISNNGIRKSFYVHRLVAYKYLPNPKNLPDINHIDGDKSNNSLSNLEWCSKEQNFKHAIDNKLINRNKLGLFI